MFYSHEILSNSQYGVSTIWLIATVGKGARKVTRRAIQDVNLPKACETIIDPGAPLALRLQGNLLYGTARVFAQQCTYVLNDAEKIQSDMLTFFRVLQRSEVDPAAGKTKRKNIVVDDDPNFDPFTALPSLDLLNSQTLLLANDSQASGTKYSQFSPFGQSQRTSSSSLRNSVINIDLPPSSQSSGTYRLPSDMNSKFSAFGKGSQLVDMCHYDQHTDATASEILGLPDIDLDFDMDGNLLGVIEHEPELPALPGAWSPLMPPSVLPLGNLPPEDGVPPLMEDDAMLPEEPLLPDAEAFAVRNPGDPTFTPVTESTQTDQAMANNRRAPRRKAKKALMLDEVDRITRDEFRSWTDDYVPYMIELNRKRQKPSTMADARKNAIDFIFGHGVADVGMPRFFGGLTHPLASYFSGDALQSMLQGREPEVKKDDLGDRGHRRSSSEAFDEDEDDDRRRVKQKLNDQAEHGHNFEADQEVILFGDDSQPELGLDQMAAMPEHHSSSVMPWSRGGSAAPGSSIRGSAKKPWLSPSPLVSRGKLLHTIERHSDVVMPGSDDFGAQMLQDDNSSLLLAAQAEDDPQLVNVAGDVATLAVDSQQFLGYVAEQAKSSGQGVNTGSGAQRWVEFEKLADPATHSKAIAAQALMHVLVLVTKNVVKVHQKGVDKGIPFGDIRIGIAVEVGASDVAM